MLVYQREPHARQMAFEAIPQPRDYRERLALADRTRADFDLTCDVVVDAMDDRSRALLGDQPNALILVGPDGTVRLKQPWADPDELERTLPELLPALAKELEAAAKKDDASLRQRVAHARATGKSELAAGPAHGRRGPDPGDGSGPELRLLIELDLASRGGAGAPDPAALAVRARRAFQGRPGAEAAFLASLAVEAAPRQRGPLLDRVVALMPEDGRAQGWAEALR